MDTIYMPLAERVRPKTIDEIIGQQALVGPQGIIRKLIEKQYLPSLILWGPPGTGKTSLARLLAESIQAAFSPASAVTTTITEVKKMIHEAKEHAEKTAQKTVLFIDEIHRFNKAQQDALLPHVEDGSIIFIGATTENPSFEVIAPLLSRCRVLVLKQLSEGELDDVLIRGQKEIGGKIDTEAKETLKRFSNGDARQLLTMYEIAISLFGIEKSLTVSDIEEAAQKKMLSYDTSGDEHYNTISAFIKSMRASDIDASLYYLARMVHAGEDPLFIARRMVIFASEDIGVAQPTALVVANAVFAACSQIGYPECQENLAHGVVYLCQAKKDRSSYDAYMLALADVEHFGNLPIPLSIRNAPTALMKSLDYGKGYQMYPIGSYLPETLQKRRYFIKKVEEGTL